MADPTSVSGLIGWWKADALTLNDGDAVGSWTDSSGAGNALVQATAGKKPLYKTKILNGMPVVRFDGTDDVLVSAGGMTGTPKHAFAVAKYAAATFANYDGLFTGVSAQADLVLTGNVGGLSSAIWYDDATLSTVYRKDGVDFAENNMVGPMNAFAYMSISCAGGWTTSLVPQIGQDRNNGARFWNGDVAEIFVYNSVLSTTDRNSIEAYLVSRYFTTHSFLAPSRSMLKHLLRR